MTSFGMLMDSPDSEFQRISSNAAVSKNPEAGLAPAFAV
jgi:hypothetical protein